MGGDNTDRVCDEVKDHFKIKALEEKALRYETENKDLRMNNQLLESQYSAQRDTQANILKTLHANLDDNFVKIEDLEQLVDHLRAQLDDSAKNHKEEMEQREIDSNLKVAELVAKCDDLQSSLDQVQDYIKRQKEVDATMEQMRQKEKEEKEAHARELSAMDRKKAIEIDQLKKDMLQKIKETRDTLRLKTKDQLDTTTKRTIMENEQMTTELSFQSREMEKLLQKNHLLIEENEKLKRNLSIHKELEQELARRTHVYQKLIKKLHDKMKEEHEHHDRLAKKETSLPKERSKDRETSNTMDTLREQLTQVHHEFSEYRRDHQTLGQLQDQATRIIIASLYDSKNAVQGPSDVPGDGSDFGDLSVHQREQFFRTLLAKLNSSFCGTCVPGGPQSPVSKLPKIGKPCLSREESAVESKGIQTSGEDNSLRIQTSMWSWTSGCENASKAEVVRGPLRNWGTKNRTLAKRLGGRA